MHATRAVVLTSVRAACGVFHLAPHECREAKEWDIHMYTQIYALRNGEPPVKYEEELWKEHTERDRNLKVYVQYAT